jgi:endonuclease/exonuclease/phosphatase (EEP) superfamily protein YafD
MNGDKPTSTSFFSLRIRWRGLLIAGGPICLLATVLGHFASLNWFLELFSHFRVQYFFGLIVCAAVACRGNRTWSAAFVGGAVANLFSIIPFYIGRDINVPILNGGKPLCAVTANVNQQFGSVARVGKMIAQVDPDILVLQEVSGSWIAELQTFTAKYEHSVVRPRNDGSGMALYSKLPLESSQVERFGIGYSPSIIANLRVRGKLLTVLATHPSSPAGQYQSHIRNTQLEALGRWAASAVAAG